MEKWPVGIDLFEYPFLDSTNAEGKRLAFKKENKTWIFTHKQIEGKGSRGRAWFSDDHNFTASFLFYPQGTLKEFAHRTFIACLALFDSLVFSGVKPDQLILKWPNDVLLNEKKVSGILLETTQSPYSKRIALIIGIGINLISSPNLTDVRSLNILPTSLKTVLGNQTPSAQQMLTYLANSLQYWEKVYRDEGFLYVKNAWLNLSYKLGSLVKVCIKGKEIQGCFQGISDDGSLLLEINDKIMELSVGDVFFNIETRSNAIV